jgi:hypothetical protein
LRRWLNHSDLTLNFEAEPNVVTCLHAELGRVIARFLGRFHVDDPCVVTAWNNL